MLDKVILALDYSKLHDVQNIVEKLSPHLEWVKVGMELFYSEGERVIDYLKRKNLKIFLDLKLMDIPHTVARSIKSLNRLSVDLLSVHASGGEEMLRAAKEQAQCELVAITLLTSLDNAFLTQQLKCSLSVSDMVINLAMMAKGAGLKYLVSSAQELPLLRNLSLQLITPGIRKRVASFDQKRTMQPRQALEAGSSLLVVGREITQSPDPLNALLHLFEESV